MADPLFQLLHLGIFCDNILQAVVFSPPARQILRLLRVVDRGAQRPDDHTVHLDRKRCAQAVNQLILPGEDFLLHLKTGMPGPQHLHNRAFPAVHLRIYVQNMLSHHFLGIEKGVIFPFRILYVSLAVTDQNRVRVLMHSECLLYILAEHITTPLYSSSLPAALNSTDRTEKSSVFSFPSVRVLRGQIIASNYHNYTTVFLFMSTNG